MNVIRSGSFNESWFKRFLHYRLTKDTSLLLFLFLAVSLICQSIESRFRPMVPGGTWEIGFPFVYSTGSSIPVHHPDGSVSGSGHYESQNYYFDFGFKMAIVICIFLFQKFFLFSAKRELRLASRYFSIAAISLALIPVWIGNYSAGQVRVGYPTAFLRYSPENSRGMRGEFLSLNFILDISVFLLFGFLAALLHKRFTSRGTGILSQIGKV